MPAFDLLEHHCLKTPNDEEDAWDGLRFTLRRLPAVGMRPLKLYCHPPCTKTDRKGTDDMSEPASLRKAAWLLCWVSLAADPFHQSYTYLLRPYVLRLMSFVLTC